MQFSVLLYVCIIYSYHLQNEIIDFLLKDLMECSQPECAKRNQGMLDLFGSSVVGLGLQNEFPAPLCVTGSTDILIVIASIFRSGAIKSVYSPGCTKSCRILAYLRDVNEIDL